MRSPSKRSCPASLRSPQPADFCGNDHDDNTRDWYAPGDADLTALVHETHPGVGTHDACVIEFQFRCVDGHALDQPEASFGA